ncbi:hypothetical protein LINPERPRIM_LOCUS17340 [Linum perenne]
MRPLLPPELR